MVSSFVTTIKQTKRPSNELFFSIQYYRSSNLQPAPQKTTYDRIRLVCKLYPNLNFNPNYHPHILAKKMLDNKIHSFICSSSHANNLLRHFKPSLPTPYPMVHISTTITKWLSANLKKRWNLSHKETPPTTDPIKKRYIKYFITKYHDFTILKLQFFYRKIIFKHPKSFYS